MGFQNRCSRYLIDHDYGIRTVVSVQNAVINVAPILVKRVYRIIAQWPLRTL